jgi:hypothetical protein
VHFPRNDQEGLAVQEEVLTPVTEGVGSGLSGAAGKRGYTSAGHFSAGEPTGEIPQHKGCARSSNELSPVDFIRVGLGFLKHGTWLPPGWKFENRNSKFETRNSKLEIRKPLRVSPLAFRISSFEFRASSFDSRISGFAS